MYIDTIGIIWLKHIRIGYSILSMFSISMRPEFKSVAGEVT